MVSHRVHIQGWLKSLRGEEWLSAFLFLIIFAMFIAPFIESVAAKLLSSLVFSLLMVTGVFSISHHPVARLLAGVVACTGIALRWLTHIAPSPEILIWNSIVTLVFMVMLTMVIITKVFSDSGTVTRQRILGAIAAYLMFGITWSVLYGLLDQIIPGAFSHSANRALDSAGHQASIAYFSFVTLTTVGYGDITPTHEISRMFMIMEALTGQLYPATLLARLVSLEVSSRTCHDGEP